MMQRPQLGSSKKVSEMLKRRDWQPQSLKWHLGRCWTQSVIVWATLKVPTMGRMGKLQMMMKKILSEVSGAKMTNPAGLMAQYPYLYSMGWSVFSRSRWSLTNWCIQAVGMQPTTSVRGIRSIGQPGYCCHSTANSIWCSLVYTNHCLCANGDNWLCPRDIANVAIYFSTRN